MYVSNIYYMYFFALLILSEAMKRKVKKPVAVWISNTNVYSIYLEEEKQITIGILAITNLFRCEWNKTWVYKPRKINCTVNISIL